jgi:hypothetical protein
MCIWAALNGKVFLVLPPAVVYFIIHICYISPSPLYELGTITTVTTFGILNDIILSHYGVVQYADSFHGTTWWTTLLWFCFGTTYWHTLSWMERYVWLSPIVGSLGVAVCYAVVEKSRAIDFLIPSHQALIIIGILWAFFYPLSLVLSRYFHKRSKESLK